jgi:hypothetical protein
MLDRQERLGNDAQIAVWQQVMHVGNPPGNGIIHGQAGQVGLAVMHGLDRGAEIHRRINLTPWHKILASEV